MNFLINKGYRFRIYPTKSQIKKLVRWESVLRFLWNLGLEQRLMGVQNIESQGFKILPKKFLKEL